MISRSRKTRGTRRGSAVVTLSLAAALVGCQSQPQPQEAAAPPVEAKPVEPVFVSDGQPIDPRTMPVEVLAARMQEAQEITARKQREAEEQARARAEAAEAARLKAEQERLAKVELEQQQAPQPSAPAGADDVVWLDSRQDGASVLRDLLMGSTQSEPAVTPAAEAPKVDPAREAAPSAVAMPGTPVAVSAANAAPQIIEAAPVTVDRRSLVADLIDQIVNSDDAPAAKAVHIAALQAIEPTIGQNDDILAALDSDRSEQVARFADLVQRWSTALQGDKAPVASVWLQKAVDEMRAYDPISIRMTELCKRVDGYGVYTPFESRTFLAGRSNAMIVYVELDNFKAVEIGDGQYEVKLQQAIEVYNEADGLRVWGSSPVQVLDRSRNRRRDFFVVQLIELPARLSVGKYLMKVRITDQHGGSVSETSIPVQFVADTAMVQRTTP